MDFTKCKVEGDCLYVMAFLIQHECDIFDALCSVLEICESRKFHEIEESILIIDVLLSFQTVITLKKTNKDLPN